MSQLAIMTWSALRPAGAQIYYIPWVVLSIKLRIFRRFQDVQVTNTTRWYNRLDISNATVLEQAENAGSCIGVLLGSFSSSSIPSQSVVITAAVRCRFDRYLSEEPEPRCCGSVSPSEKLILQNRLTNKYAMYISATCILDCKFLDFIQATVFQTCICRIWGTESALATSNARTLAW